MRLCAIGILALSCGLVLAQESEQSVRFHPRGGLTITLEGMLQVPTAGSLVPGVVICHPDPRYGGSMASHVVCAVQRACAKDGWATLRLNLRGVGQSEGSFDDGEGEKLDCLGALDFLRRTQGVDPNRIALVGYSFGSWVGLRACVLDKRVRGCACLAFPVPESENPERHPYFREIRFPALFVTGTVDPISDLGSIRRIIALHEAGERCTVTELAGADHFFWRQEQLGEAVRAIHDFVKRVCCAPPTPVEGEGEGGE